MDEASIAAHAAMDWTPEDERGGRRVSDETEELAAQLRSSGFDASAHIVELKSENKLQAKRIEELEKLRPSFERIAGQRMADAINELVKQEIIGSRCVAADASLDWADPDFKRLDDIESLQAQNAKLKEENATLRATAELVGRALRDYVLAQSSMVDNWAEGDDAVKSQLWKNLHFCEPCGREALEALRYNTPSPTNRPSCSDGSDT